MQFEQRNEIDMKIMLVYQICTERNIIREFDEKKGYMRTFFHFLKHSLNEIGMF